jgi:hypothetical protein
MAFPAVVLAVGKGAELAEDRFAGRSSTCLRFWKGSAARMCATSTTHRPARRAEAGAIQAALLPRAAPPFAPAETPWDP